jgi:hypothetical protein
MNENTIFIVVIHENFKCFYAIIDLNTNRFVNRFPNNSFTFKKLILI